MIVEVDVTMVGKRTRWASGVQLAILPMMPVYVTMFPTCVFWNMIMVGVGRIKNIVVAISQNTSGH